MVVPSTEEFLRAKQSLVELTAQEGLLVSDSTLMHGYLPLVQMLRNWPRRANTGVVGLAGPPGAGKTTMGQILERLVPAIGGGNLVSVSIDDFYLGPEHRQAMGYRWRAVPGTHDLCLLRTFLDDISGSEPRISIPRYDVVADMRLPPQCSERPDLVVIEGWFVGTPIDGYSVLRTALDARVYADVSIEVAYSGRVSRVRRRARSLFGRRADVDEIGVFWEHAMAFWYEVQLPGTYQWVQPLREESDIVVHLDHAHQITGIECHKRALGVKSP